MRYACYIYNNFRDCVNAWCFSLRKTGAQTSVGVLFFLCWSQLFYSISFHRRMHWWFCHSVDGFVDAVAGQYINCSRVGLYALSFFSFPLGIVVAVDDVWLDGFFYKCFKGNINQCFGLNFTKFILAGNGEWSIRLWCCQSKKVFSTITTIQIIWFHIYLWV